MAEKFEVASIALSGGQVDSKAGIALQSPEMALVRNGEFVADGRIQKRRGTQLLADFPSSKYDVAAAMVHRKSLHMLTSRGAHNLHDTPSSQDIGVDQNPGPLPCELTEAPVVRGRGLRDPCTCVMESPADSFPAIFVWQEADSDTIWFMLRDQVTGSVIRDPSVLAAGDAPRVAPLPGAGVFAILWNDSGAVMGRLVNATTGSFVGGAVTIIADTAFRNDSFDVVVEPLTETLHVAAWGGTNTTLIREVDDALAATGRNVNGTAGTAPTQGNVSVIIGPSSNLRLAALYSEGGTNYVFLQNVALSTYTETAGAANSRTTLPQSTVAQALDSTGDVWLGISAIHLPGGVASTHDSAGYTRIYEVGTGVALPGTYYEAPGHVMAACPFLPAGGYHTEPWFPTLHYYRSAKSQRSLQAYGQVLVPMAVTVEDTQGGQTTTKRVMMPVARWGSDVAQLPPSAGLNEDVTLPEPRRAFQRDDGLWSFAPAVIAFAYVFTAEFSAGDGGLSYPVFGSAGTLELGADEVRVNPFPDPLRVAQATPHGLPVAAGGCSAAHDGWQMHETTLQGFPEPPMYEHTNAAGAINAKFRWRACWRWTDAEGRIRRGAPSLATAQLDLVNQANTDVTLKFLCPPPTAIVGVNLSHLSLEIYEQTDAVDSLYRLHSSYVYDSPTISDLAWFTVTITSIAAGTGGPVLYTEGGELTNDCLPATLDVCVAAGRVWALSGEDPTRLYPGKLPAEEAAQTRGPEFSKALALRLPEPARAIAPLDDRVLVLCERGVYVVQGDGPDNLGQGSGFSVSRLAADFGIRDPRSAVEFPLGVAFVGPRGVWMVGRDLSMEFVGEHDELVDNRVISTLAVPTRSELRFHLSETPSGGNGAFQSAAGLVWDYLGKRWSEWTHGAGAAVIRNDEVERIQLGGSPGVPGVYRELDGTFDDAEVIWQVGESFILSGGYCFAVTTPHIRPQGRDGAIMKLRSAMFVTDAAPDGNTEGITVSYVKDYGANLASGSGSATFADTDVNGALAIEVFPAGTSSNGMEAAAIQFTFAERANGVQPPEGQLVPTSVAFLTLELALLPGLLRGLPTTLRK